MWENTFLDDTEENDYLFFYFDEEAQTIMPRFNMGLIKLENLTEWLREENDKRRSPLYILETLVFSDWESEGTEISNRSQNHGESNLVSGF